MDVNFYGTIFCTKYALPYILKSKGSVVGVSSIAGYKGLPARSAYSASKVCNTRFFRIVKNRKFEERVTCAYSMSWFYSLKHSQYSFI